MFDSEIDNKITTETKTKLILKMKSFSVSSLHISAL